MINYLLDFLQRVDKDFPTHLSKKVDLRKYAQKIIDNGSIISTLKDNKIIGMVVIYCNNIDSLYAYVPLVAIDINYRGQKISRALMLGAINYAKGLGFKKIGIHTENSVALNLYIGLGFKIIDGTTERKYLELNL